MLRSGSKPRIIFFPGLGCDRRIGKAHDRLPAQVEWADWLPLEPAECFCSYSERLAVAAGVTEDCYLAGISLGGLAALHIARRLKTRGVILIGSMRSSAGVNPAIRQIVQKLLCRIPADLHHLGLLPHSIGRKVFGLDRPADYALLLSMVGEQRRQDLKRLCQLAVSVPRPVEPDCPVFSIHGTADRVLNYFEDETDVAIRDAGHFISVTHGEAVNSAICRFLEEQTARETVLLPIPMSLRRVG